MKIAVVKFVLHDKVKKKISIIRGGSTASFFFYFTFMDKKMFSSLKSTNVAKISSYTIGGYRPFQSLIDFFPSQSSKNLYNTF